MPKELLTAVKNAVNPSGGVIQGGALRVLVGDYNEVRNHDVSYVITLGVLTQPTTNIPIDNLATLE
jgi:hypothetical protein